MIDGLKPYPAMKDSGVPWLGEVPEHWEAASVKRHYAIQLGKMLQNRPEGPADAEVAYLKAQHVQWFSVRTASPPKMWASPRDITQFGIAAGDLLVCEGGEGGRSGIVGDIPSGLIIQNALHRVRPHGGCLNGYLQYVMSAVSATGWFDAINNKATIAHFTREKFGALGMPVPSRDEQAAIVRFLDHADRRIRRYIRAKQKLIKLLEELKTAITHRAVTRGLDPTNSPGANLNAGQQAGGPNGEGRDSPSSVRLKPSGVEWLGDVPEHWEVVRLKNVASHIVDCLHATPTYTERGQFPAIRTADITPGAVHLRTARRVDDKTYERWTERLEPAAGDILYSREGERFGIAACVPPDARLCISQRMMVVRVRPEHNSSFVMWALNSPQTYAQATQDVMGSTAPHVNVSTIRNFALALPALDEQCRIVEHIESATPALRGAIEDAGREIDLLREYRTRLIADVVTGKLDVREAAARLPQEAEDLEPLDATEGEPDADESADDLDAEAGETAA